MSRGEDGNPYGGPNPYDRPQYGPPQYGPPQYGPPQYVAPQYGPPQYLAPQYGAPPPDPYRPPPYAGHAGYGYPAPPRNAMGIAAVVLGALALVFSWTILGGFLFGVLGIVFAVIHKGRIRRRQATGAGMGVTAVVLSVVGIAIAGALVALGAWLFGTRSENYLDCVNNANGNQQEIQHCIDRYLSRP